MRTRRLLIAFAIAAVAAPAVAVTATAPAAAAEATADDLELTCFPHERSDELRYDNTWGAARSGGRAHKGTDIMTPKGLEVRAVADGVVKTLRNGSKSGYYVRLEHEGGWESWYMHLNNDDAGTDNGRGGADTAYAEGIEVGAFVRAGQVIAYVGDSGNAEWTGPHTHFELHIDGTAVNPYPYLVDVQAREDAAAAVVAELAVAPIGEVEKARRSDVWGQLLVNGTAQCLPDPLKDIVQHTFGELPSEGVLLARVVAR